MTKEFGGEQSYRTGKHGMRQRASDRGKCRSLDGVHWLVGSEEHMASRSGATSARSALAVPVVLAKEMTWWAGGSMEMFAHFS